MKTSEISAKIEEAQDYIHNDTLKAIQIFDEVLEIDPENIDALNGKGSSLIKLKLLKEADKYFDYSLSIRKTPSAFINKGIISKNNKDYKKALFYYDKAIRTNPDLTNIVTQLKNEIYELMDDKEEIKLPSFSENANELIKKGNAYKKSDCLWDALDCYKKAIESDSDCINFTQGLINEVKVILQKEFLINTPSLGPSRIDQLKLKCSKLLKEQNHEQALTLMNLILENDENDLDTLNQKGTLLYFYDKHSDAIECFDECLKIDENYSYALFNKGIVLRSMKNLNEALKCFDELLKTPENYKKVKPYQLEILSTIHQKELT